MAGNVHHFSWRDVIRVLRGVDFAGCATAERATILEAAKTMQGRLAEFYQNCGGAVPEDPVAPIIDIDLEQLLKLVINIEAKLDLTVRLFENLNIKIGSIIDTLEINFSLVINNQETNKTEILYQTELDDSNILREFDRLYDELRMPTLAQQELRDLIVTHQYDLQSLRMAMGDMDQEHKTLLVDNWNLIFDNWVVMRNLRTLFFG